MEFTSGDHKPRDWRGTFSPSPSFCFPPSLIAAAKLLQVWGTRELRKFFEEKKTNEGFLHTLWMLRDCFFASGVRARGLFLELMRTSGLGAALSSHGRDWKKKWASHRQFWILWIRVFFPHLPALTYSSESPSNCSNAFCPGVLLLSAGEMDYSVPAPAQLGWVLSPVFTSGQTMVTNKLWFFQLWELFGSKFFPKPVCQRWNLLLVILLSAKSHSDGRSWVKMSLDPLCLLFKLRHEWF